MIPQFERVCSVLLPLIHRRAQAELPDHRHRFSPKKFTEPQLATIVALKQFLRTTYREVTLALRRSQKARDLLGLRRVPHYSALCHAEKRLRKALETIWSPPVDR